MGQLQLRLAEDEKGAESELQCLRSCTCLHACMYTQVRKTYNECAAEVTVQVDPAVRISVHCMAKAWHLPAVSSGFLLPHGRFPPVCTLPPKAQRLCIMLLSH